MKLTHNKKKSSSPERNLLFLGHSKTNLSGTTISLSKYEQVMTYGPRQATDYNIRNPCGKYAFSEKMTKQYQNLSEIFPP